MPKKVAKPKPTFESFENSYKAALKEIDKEVELLLGAKKDRSMVLSNYEKAELVIRYKNNISGNRDHSTWGFSQADVVTVLNTIIINKESAVKLLQRRANFYLKKMQNFYR